jgi:hypothetical protein
MTASANPATPEPNTGPAARVTLRPRTPGLRSAGPQPAPQRRPTAETPLLAVCGLCGGAGASTLSYLVARWAIGVLDGHVLVCDTGGPTGGLAAYAGVESPRTLMEIAEHVRRGRPLAGGIYAVDDAASTARRQLRVIAAGQCLDAEPDGSALPALLAMARSDGAHSLTVVDCGTLQRDADRLAFAAASHVAWVLPATGSAARRAERVLAAISRRVPGRELVAARRENSERAAPLRTLRALAERRGAPLVLVPQLGDLVDRPGRALTEAEVSLQAIHGVLQR